MSVIPLTDCDTADRCVFDIRCPYYLTCSQADPQGLAMQELIDRMAAAEKRISELESRNN